MEHVCRVFVKLFGPASDPFADTQQLRSDAKSIADTPETAVDHVIDSEIAPCDEGIDRCAVITQHAAGRTHDEALHVTEASNQRVSQPNAEILIAGVFPRRTHHSKRQHRDRFEVCLQLSGERRQCSESMV